jgi:SAM-dependent methyltransferase
VADDEQGSPAYDELLQALRHRVEERRRAGDYPDGLEGDLDRHFRRVQGMQGTHVTTEQLLGSIESVRGASHFDRSRIEGASRLPGGELAHRAVSKAVGREIDGVLDQLRQFSDSVRGALELLTEAVDDPPRHLHPDLLGILYALDEQVAAIQRRLVLDDDPYRALVARIDELEARIGSRALLPPYSTAALRDVIEGDDEERAARAKALADQVQGGDQVLDLRCGRGELLDVLREREVRAEGVESDDELRREASAKGHVVHGGDGTSYLSRLPEASLGAIVADRVVEQLDASVVIELVVAAAHGLREGGRLVIGTPNPESLDARARFGGLDPSVSAFVHPGYLQFLALQAGFRQVELVRISPVPDDQRLLEIPPELPSADLLNTNVDRLNRVLFAHRDALVVATR